MTMTAQAAARIGSAAIDRLLRPKSVAIVGASATPGSLGHSLLVNLERVGFRGPIHLINPRRDEINERRCLKSIDELPAGVDVAVLAIPRAAVLESVRQLAVRAVGSAIIFSSGFAEVGAQGLAEQREIARIAREAGLVVLGPNCLGVINFMEGIALSFVTVPPSSVATGKRIGIVSQSGAMAVVVATTLMSRSLSLSFYISTGNETGSGIEDYVEYLLCDSDTQVIAVVAEQLRQPRRFLSLAHRAREGAAKQIVLLHPGRSAAARESAASHTGAMAGDYRIMQTLVERAGVIVCRDLEEYGDVLELTVRYGSLRPGTAVLGESGAFKALALDTAEAVGLDLPPLTDALSPRLRAAMPDFVAISNPIDLTAQALVDPDLYRRTLDALLGDERIGSIILSIIQTDARTARRKFPFIIDTIAQLKPTKTVIFTGVDEGADVPPEYICALRELNVSYFPTADRAMRAVARVVERAQRDFVVCEPDSTSIDLSGMEHVVPEHRAKELLGRVGVPFPQARFASTPDEAMQAAAEVGYPIALKAQSAQLSHKSDAGGVILGIADPIALASAWRTISENVVAYDRAIQLDGMLVERMAQRGTELIVGARNDPDWGPVILVGLGGVLAELFRDTRLLPPDLTREAIIRELYQLRCGALLRGYRGAPALDVGAMADLVVRIGGLLRAEPRIGEIDLNPVVLYSEGEGVIALDALIVLR